MNNNVEVVNASSDSVPERTTQDQNLKKSRNPKWFQLLLMYPALLIAIIGAIPQYSNWIIALMWGIPSDSLAVAKEQIRLWGVNFECSKKGELEMIPIPKNYKIGALVCPSGDVLVKMEPPTGENPSYRWIGLNTFLDTNNRFGPKEAKAQTVFFDKATAIAQSERVLCQKRHSDGNIVRVIMDSNGKCWKERINPRTGRVIERVQVSCGCSCD